ncbi:MAG: aminoglycoside phosphotransferase family protein [Reyranella sp.]|nr:aminoglycoside phosphotransferase family protein [Reyranella sp.]
MAQEAAAGDEPDVLGALVRIGPHLAWEAVARPVARRLGDVPRRIEAITAEWLTAVLCGGTPGAEVNAFAFGPGSSGTSVRRQILLTYNAAGAAARLPTTLFAKSTPSALTQLVNGFSGTTAIEALFYSRLRPELILEAPIGYHSAYSLRSYRSIHLLEDLVATKQATFCSPRGHINRDQANDIVDILAALHSCFYDDRRIRTGFVGLKAYPRWFHDANKWANLRHHHERAMTEAAAVIPADVLARRDHIWPALMRSFEAHETQPSTILHSDVHLGNWYITGAGRMGLCDWQCVITGLWARDVAYAISATLTVDDRRAWERELLERYLEKMRAGTGHRFDFQPSWDLYRQQMFAALLMWTPTLCHSPLFPDMQPRDICFEMIKRMTAAISDLGSLDAFPSA